MDSKFLFDFLGIKLDGNFSVETEIVIDSRKIKQNDIFVAIKGNSFNANEFARDAIKKKALLAIVDEEEYADNIKVIYVKDTVLFLGKLAKAWVNYIKPKVYGITGSSGKTTVKEMVANILKDQFGEEHVLVTAGNFNNHIGLPLTLLKLNKDHKYAVVEMGMNHKGELKYLTEIASPDIALVNNIQNAHIGCDFDGLEDIARAKGEIFELEKKIIAVLPYDCQQKEILKSSAKSNQIITFGVQESADVSAQNIKLKSQGSLFLLKTLKGETEIHLNVPGIHNVLNALAATALLIDDSIDLKSIAKSFSQFTNISGRLHIEMLTNRIRVIDDTYNANPESMKAAIDVLAQFLPPRYFVMGNMAELGACSKKFHQEIGTYAKEKGIEYGLFVGDETFFAAQTFGSGSFYFKKKYDLHDYLKQNLLPQSTVLVKGSRNMKMEETVDFLKKLLIEKQIC